MFARSDFISPHLTRSTPRDGREIQRQYFQPHSERLCFLMTAAICYEYRMLSPLLTQINQQEAGEQITFFRT